MEIVTYRCDTCDLEIEGWAPKYHYQLADGTTARAMTTSAWCNDCSTLVQVEQAPDYFRRLRAEGVVISVEAVDPQDEKDRLALEERVRPPAGIRGLPIEFFRSLRQERGRLQRAMAERTAWSRCLTCGGFEHFLLDPERDLPLTFTHPGCKGTFRRCAVVVPFYHRSSLKSDATPREPCEGPGFPLDLEGNRISS